MNRKKATPPRQPRPKGKHVKILMLDATTLEVVVDDIAILRIDGVGQVENLVATQRVAA